MIRWPHRRPLPLALVGLFFFLVRAGGLPMPAAADESQTARLAPPGICAEPREALAGSGMMASSFAVAGPIAALFAPADVAAPAPPARLGVPSAPGLVRPGPCDQPGAGCAPTPQLASPGLPNPPVVPGIRPGP